jgi:putative DNA primase/helicase
MTDMDDNQEAVVGDWFSNQELNEAKIKDLTGGDTISARFLHREFFDYQPNFKLWMYGNHFPQVQGSDRGIWRRFKVIPCEAVIRDDLRDNGLSDKLIGERPGILNWALEGHQQWQEHGLGDCRAVERATGEYRREVDHIEQFLCQATRLASGERVQASELYDAYTEWCEQENRKAMTQTMFGRVLASRDRPARSESRGKRYWNDIRILGQGEEGSR